LSGQAASKIFFKTSRRVAEFAEGAGEDGKQQLCVSCAFARTSSVSSLLSHHLSPLHRSDAQVNYGTTKAADSVRVEKFR